MLVCAVASAETAPFGFLLPEGLFAWHTHNIQQVRDSTTPSCPPASGQGEGREGVVVLNKWWLVSMKTDLTNIQDAQCPGAGRMVAGRI